jgi:two-component SAPR family response regulator
MPSFLNLDLAQFVQNAKPGIKVIVMSGFVDSVEGELPRNARFLHRPWQPDQMMRNILRATEECEFVQATGRVLH